VYSSIFGIVKNTVLASLIEAHDRFAHQSFQAKSNGDLPKSGGRKPSGSTDVPRQLLPSDVDPLEFQLRQLQKARAQLTAKVEQLEATLAQYRKKLGGNSASAATNNTEAVVPATDAGNSKLVSHLQDLNAALTTKNETLVALLRAGGMVASPVQSKKGDHPDAKQPAPVARLMRPKINLSLIQRQFDALYQQRVNVTTPKNTQTKSKEKQEIVNHRSQSANTKPTARNLASPESVLPQSVFAALTGKVFTKDKLSRLSVPVQHTESNAQSLSTKSRPPASHSAHRARFFDYFAIVAFTPPNAEDDWTAKPLVETIQRYPETDHADFPFETRLAQFACAPAVRVV